MKTKLILFILLLAGFTLAQEPQVKIPLIITDGVDQDTLYFGLDPDATSDIDASLGEEELPPFPPTGVFSTRFVSNSFADLGQGSAEDYRTGSSSGTYQHKHKLHIQLGTGSERIINYDLPSGVTLILKDPITGGQLVNDQLTGSGEYVFAYDQAAWDMTADYNIDLLLSPYGLNADDTTPGQIDLNWSDDNTNETGFIIERQDPVTRAFDEIDRTGADETTYTDETAEQTQTYQYRVKAYNDAGESLPSNVAEGTVGIVPITAPSDLVAEATVFGKIDLAWTDNSDNEDIFYIERSEPALRAFEIIDSVVANTEVFIDSNVEENTTYIYRVKASNQYTESGYSNEAEETSLIEPIDAPSALTIDNTTPGQLDLSWTDNSDNETGFVIERVSEFLRDVVIDTTDANATSYTDTDVEQNETYVYRMKAINDLTESNYSDTASGTVKPFPIDAPSELTAVAETHGQIDLTWTDNSDNEDGFYIFRELAEEPRAFEIYDSVNANIEAYSDTDVEDGLTYSYYVQAYNQFTISDNSNEAQETAIVKPIEAPTELTATANETGGIDLAWTDNSDNETGFNIEREDPVLREFIKVASVSEDVTVYSDTTLDEGVTYKYRVQGFNNLTESEYSNEASASTVMGAPSELTIEANAEETLYLTWKDNSGSEDGFVIERQEATTRADNYQLVDTVDQNITEYTDNNLPENTTYQYRIKAFNQFTETTYSAASEGTTLINAPDSAVAANLDIKKIEITWNDDSDVEEGYTIERSVGDADNFAEHLDAGSDATSIVDTNIIEGTKYYYRVNAYAGENKSDYSSVGEIVSLIASPTELVGTPDEYANVDLVWVDNSANESGYKVEREDPVLRAYQVIAELPSGSTTYEDNTTDEATTYKYRVSAYNDLISSEYSNVQEVTTVTIAAPDSATAEPTDDGNVNLTWGDNSDVEDGFTIERTNGGALIRDVPYVVIDSVVANTTTFTDTSTVEGSQYKYRVKAYNATDASSESETNDVETVPVASPSKLVPTVTLNNASPTTWDIKLSWKDNSEVENGFKLEREITNGTTREYVEVSDLNANSTLYSDTALATKQTVQYRLLAYGTDTTSAYVYTDPLRLNYQPELAGMPDISFNEDNSTTLALNQFVTDLDDDSTQLVFAARVLAEQTKSKVSEEKKNKSSAEGIANLTVTITDNIAKFEGAKDEYGEFEVEFTVEDSDEAEDTDTIKVTIEPVNDSPVVSSIPSIELDEDSETTLDLNKYVRDVDNNDSQIEWTVDLPAVNLITKNNKSKTKGAVNIGTKSSQALATFNPADYNIKHYENTLVILMSGDINDSLTITIDPSNNEATITATNNFNGENIPVEFTATDPGGLSDADETTITVAPVNDPPVLSIPTEINLYNNIDTTIAIDQFVEDDETPFDQLTFNFVESNDSVTVSRDGTMMRIQIPTKLTGTVDVDVTVTDGGGLSSDTTITLFITPNGILSLGEIPKTYVLENNYPNPFNPSTIIRFGLPFRSHVSLEVFNILGQRVETLITKDLEAGFYEFQFNASRLASGVYIYTITAESETNDESFHSIKKMMYVK